MTIHPLIHAQKILRPVARPIPSLSKCLISDCVVWPEIKSDIPLWVRTCIPWQKAKVSRYTWTPVEQFPTPGERFTHVHLDITGPLTHYDGFSYILTRVDRFSRWYKAQPMIDIIANTTEMSGWIACFGVPSATDCEWQCGADLFRSLSKLLGCKKDLHYGIPSSVKWSGGTIPLYPEICPANSSISENWIEHLRIILIRLRISISEI